MVLPPSRADLLYFRNNRATYNHSVTLLVDHLMTFGAAYAFFHLIDDYPDMMDVPTIVLLLRRGALISRHLAQILALIPATTAGVDPSIWTFLTNTATGMYAHTPADPLYPGNDYLLFRAFALAFERDLEPGQARDHLLLGFERFVIETQFAPVLLQNPRFSDAMLERLRYPIDWINAGREELWRLMFSAPEAIEIMIQHSGLDMYMSVPSIRWRRRTYGTYHMIWGLLVYGLVPGARTPRRGGGRPPQDENNLIYTADQIARAVAAFRNFYPDYILTTAMLDQTSGFGGVGLSVRGRREARRRLRAVLEALRRYRTDVPKWDGRRNDRGPEGPPDDDGGFGGGEGEGPGDTGGAGALVAAA